MCILGYFRGFPRWLRRHNCREFESLKILSYQSYFLPLKPCPYQFSCKTNHFLTSNAHFLTINSQLCAFWGYFRGFPVWLWLFKSPKFKFYKILTSPSYFSPSKPFQNLIFAEFWRHHCIFYPKYLVHSDFHAKLIIFWRVIAYYVHFGVF